MFPSGPLQQYEVLHLCRWYTHTHTPQQRGRWNDNESEMKMKMKWKLLNQDAKRGTQKKRERANTNTNTPGPERANPEKARKEKTEADGNGTRPAEEGEDGSAWTNLPRRNLSLPRHAQDPTYLERVRTHEIRDPWGKKLVTWCMHTACESRDKAQRPSEVKSQPCKRLT